MYLGGSAGGRAATPCTGDVRADVRAAESWVYAKAASGVMIRIDGIRKDIDDTLSLTSWPT